MASSAKKRKMNFSEREVEIIVEEIEKHKHTLVNHYNAGVTHMAKNGAWLHIVRRVNAVTTCPRELAEVKKKWSDMKTEVRRKVAQARCAIEGTAPAGAADPAAPVAVILTAMQQRICNLLGEATIISLPQPEHEQEHEQEQEQEIALPATVVTLTEAGQDAVCDDAKTLSAEETFHPLEDGGVVEYCTTIVGDSAAPPPAAVAEAPVDVLGAAPASPAPLCQGQAQGQVKPQELKSRIALNSARLLQEQRVTNVHVGQMAQHLEGQNQLLQMMRRSQEAQALAQERQAQALEGTQAALLALVQMLRPALKDLRKFLQAGPDGSPGAALGSAAPAPAAAEGTANGAPTAEEEQSRTQTPPPQPQLSQ